MSKTSIFIDKIGKMATLDMKNTGILASLTIAQAILESGWGESTLTVNANNLFGIKATIAWKGKVYDIDTKECYDGSTFVIVNATFKAYDSWADSVADHSALLTGSSRYAKVVGETDYKVACQAIKDAGYATDPSYPSKLITLIEQYKLYEFDTYIDDEQEEEEMRYNTVAECPDWGKATIQRMLDNGEIVGTGNGLNLTEDMIRCFVCNEKMLERLVTNE